MKTLILVFFTALPFAGFAQKNTSLKINAISPVNEIGLAGSIQSISNTFKFGTAGIQYKHWITEHLGWHAMVGYGSYSTTDDHSSIRYTPDTIYSKQIKDRIGMPVIGLGLEAQRKFYKRVYMYAALDLQAGYGAGRTDTTIQKQYILPGEKSISSSSFDNRSENNDVNMLFIGFTPTVGAKLQFNHISVGTEISPIQATSRIENRPSISSSTLLFDFSFGGLFQRFFITYRF